jgi:hypothetical protein
MGSATSTAEFQPPGTSRAGPSAGRLPFPHPKALNQASKPQAPKLYLVARLWLDLTRQLHKVSALDKQGQFGNRASILAIGVAVYLGTVEGRPMTATKIAAFVGMPRPTAIRRLRLLCRRGAVEKVGNTYRTTEVQLDRVARRDVDAMVRLVRQAGEALRP